ncbi:MAG: hypothetical protein L3J47_00190 [Sulfurovum sp.]|nr:hypothetical protein [Sulfurovum sp.]
MGDDLDLDQLAEEISAAVEPKKEELVVFKKTADDIADRRKLAWGMKQRGMTLRAIGAKLDVSAATVKRDVDIIIQQERANVLAFDREEHVASTISMYNYVISECDAINRNSNDPDIQLKALTQIRQTVQAREKSLQSTGVLHKENPVVDTVVKVALVANMSGETLGQTAAALIGTKLTLHLAPPTLDIEDAEFEEYTDEEEEKETNET